MAMRRAPTSLRFDPDYLLIRFNIEYFALSCRHSKFLDRPSCFVQKFEAICVGYFFPSRIDLVV